jgi:hypothetical protein
VVYAFPLIVIGFTNMKWLLLALGGYVLYEYLYGTPTTTTSAQGGTTVATGANPPTGGTTVTTTPPSGGTGGSGSVAPPKTGVSAQSLQAAAGKNTMLTADQWNYFYSKISGVHQTADLFATGSRAQPIDVNTYLARRATAGLGGHSVQGLSRFSPDYGNVAKYFRGM